MSDLDSPELSLEHRKKISAQHQLPMLASGLSNAISGLAAASVAFYTRFAFVPSLDWSCMCNERSNTKSQRWLFKRCVNCSFWEIRFFLLFQPILTAIWIIFMFWIHLNTSNVRLTVLNLLLGELKDFQMSRFTWGQTSLIHFQSCRYAHNQLCLLKNNGHVATSR